MLGSQTGMLGNSSKHFSTEFLAIVKGELVVRPPVAGQQLVGTALSLDAPADSP